MQRRHPFLGLPGQEGPASRKASALRLLMKGKLASHRVDVPEALERSTTAVEWMVPDLHALHQK
jgi:hypothetical protein